MDLNAIVIHFWDTACGNVWETSVTALCVTSMFVTSTCYQLAMWTVENDSC